MGTAMPDLPINYGTGMIEIERIAANLEHRGQGIWVSRGQSIISYPDDGNAFCYGIEDNSFWFKHRSRCIVEMMRSFPPGGIVFDAGGGNGCVSLALNRAGIETILVEPGSTGVQNARQRGLCPIICSRVEEAGFTLHSLPAVGVFDVLEHIEDDESFLKLINKLLKPNGRLYLTVPTYQFLWSVADVDAGHFRRYTLKSLTATLAQCGYRVEFGSYFFCLLILPTYLFRTLPSRVGLRKGGALAGYRKEIAQTAGWVNYLFDFLLSFEAKQLANRKTLPFGGSCLVVARTSS
jgi:SAM-dependent methyltransferase